MSVALPSSSHPAKPQQILLRLPSDLSQRFAQLVPQRQRSKFVLDLLRNALDKESAALEAAALQLSALEHGQTEVTQESQAWVNAHMAELSDDGFDAQLFESEWLQAQQAAQNP